MTGEPQPRPCHLAAIRCNAVLVTLVGCPSAPIWLAHSGAVADAEIVLADPPECLPEAA
jgi:hypothetical protein